MSAHEEGQECIALNATHRTTPCRTYSDAWEEAHFDASVYTGCSASSSGTGRPKSARALLGMPNPAVSVTSWRTSAWIKQCGTHATCSHCLKEV